MNKLRLYVQLARPFTLLPPLIGVLSGAVCAFGSYHNPDPERVLSGSVLFAIVLGSVCAAIMNAASNILNQVYDLEIDRLNKPHRPLVTGEVGRNEGLALAWILYAVALLPTWMIIVYPYTSWAEKWQAPLALRETFFVYAAGMFFTLVYSIPQLGRTKARGLVANWTMAIPRGLLKVGGWTLVAHVYLTEPWYMAGIFALFLVGASSTKDFADIEGDLAGGCRTLPIVYGVEKAAKIIAPFFVVPWVFLPIGAYLPDPQNPSHPILTGNAPLLALLGVVLSIWGAYTARLLLQDPASLAKVENHPSWRHMYMMMMFAQVGFAVAYLV